ncbi:MAG: thiamine phosphate synthase [Planctomycetes bacterium]|nr:thiamine phosphate synthase [Planctomycetota bacterium]
MMPDQPHRILDASANRATEGLRVVEDFTRFILDDAHLTKITKNLRHSLAAACADLPLAERHAARETQHDVGTTITTTAEAQRSDAQNVCTASLERTKQSLRSLEEYSKVVAPEISSRFESLRYQLYTLERSLSITQTSIAQLENVPLCVLIDGQPNVEQFTSLVAQLVEAGTPMIQLRDKQLTDAELVQRARLLRTLVPRQEGSAILMINDRPDIAAAVGADGVHLGQDDLSVKDARKILGPRKLIGVSTHSIEQARTAVLDGANYLGAGPTFASETKTFDQFPGLGYLSQVAGEIRLPTYAIGGINAENLSKVLTTGITRIAVSNTVTASPNPKNTTKQLLKTLPKHTPP